jgi:glyoxylase-like metal-dependent hydrolase (beta-lactamase superfamily II)
MEGPDDVMETGTPHTAVRIDRVEGDVMPVNSFLVHGPNGVVIVDAQLTLPDADKVRRAAEQAGLPVAGVLVTHPHPDHYAGAARLLDGLDVPIVATGQVDAVIRRDDAVKDAGRDIELGGLTFHVTDVGPGESDADTVWTLDDHTVFAGDVAYNGMHAFLADGRHVQWLALLDRLSDQLTTDATLYLGHGEPVGTEVLSSQRRYVETFVAAVWEASDLDVEARRTHVVDAMRSLVSDDKLQFLMELSIEPVLATLGVRPT